MSSFPAAAYVAWTVLSQLKGFSTYNTLLWAAMFIRNSKWKRFDSSFYCDDSIWCSHCGTQPTSKTWFHARFESFEVNFNTFLVHAFLCEPYDVFPTLLYLSGTWIFFKLGHFCLRNCIHYWSSKIFLVSCSQRNNEIPNETRFFFVFSFIKLLENIVSQPFCLSMDQTTRNSQANPMKR